MPDSPPGAPAQSPATAPETEGVAARGISLKGRSLRQQTARGTILNSAFYIGLSSLGLLRGFVVAAFLTASDYGIWGILAVSLGLLHRLKDVGVGDKYIQQSDADQERAFQKAFTLELIFTSIFLIVVLAAVPFFAFVYGRPEIIAPGFAITLALPAALLQTPLLVFYRRMEFLKQRVLDSIGPVVGFVATVGLAVAGMGYWSLVLGMIAGNWAAALVIIKLSPYRIALRYDRGTMKEYVGFSWPLLVASASSLVIAQGSTLAGEAVVGLAGVGVITLAHSISQYTNQVDAIVTDTLYPAICAVRDRTDLLFEAFVKSNRLALMWGVPFGVGIALYAPDLIEFGLGEKWRPALTLIQAFGLIAAAGHVGFNWDAFFRARAETRPMAAVGAASVISFFALTLPLMITNGLDGFALGMGLMTVIAVGLRGFYLSRLFDGFQMLKHAGRAIAPTVPAVAVVFAVRMVEPWERTLPLALGELVLYLGVTAAATLAFERALLREVVGYVRGARAPAEARG